MRNHRKLHLVDFLFEYEKNSSHISIAVLQIQQLYIVVVY
jgi:hypothetical protein